MYIIKSPNKYYDGITANVQFKNGTAESELKQHIVEWFKSKGYCVEEINTITSETKVSKETKPKKR